MSELEHQNPGPNPVEESDLARWIAELHQADQTVQDMMAVELWAIIQTIDEVLPGFWGQYMSNRHTAMRKFLDDRRQRKQAGPSSEAPTKPKSARSLKPLATASPLVSYFSQRLDPPASTSTTPLPVVPPGPVTPTPVSAEIEPPKSTDFQVTAPSAQRLGVVQQRLTQRPHLQHQPWVQILSANTPESTSAALGLTRLAIACWSTPHFWTPNLKSDDTFVLQQAADYVLKPGELVICALGFHLPGIASPVKVELPRSQPATSTLSATWMADLPRIPFSLRQQARQEYAVQLHNRGTQPYVIKAGDPLCRLEFYWAETLS